MEPDTFVSPSAHAGLSRWALLSGLNIEDSMDGRIQCGVDLVDVARIREMHARWGDRFLQRVWTKAELLQCRGRYPELAARFAAKEATSKALGTGIEGILWREIEIVPDKRGKPLLFLHGSALKRAEKLDLRTWSVSISHTRDLAAAFVVAMIGR